MALAFDIHESFPVAPPSGGQTTTRLRLTAEEERVVGELVDVVATARRRDLAQRSTRGTMPGPDSPERAGWNAVERARKVALTSETNSRWANSIIRGNDTQYKLSRRVLRAELASKKAAVETIAKRADVPCGQTIELPRKGRKPEKVKGYRDQHERAMKLVRLQRHRQRIDEIQSILDSGNLNIIDGGRKLLNKRHNLDAAGLTEAQWRTEWEAERAWVFVTGAGDETFGNSTVNIAPDGRLRISLPVPMRDQANGPHNRYHFTHAVNFNHGGDEWRDRAIAGQPIAYRIYRNAKNGGWYLTASWAKTEEPIPEIPGRTLGLDLNGNHVAGYILDEHGNPVGDPLTWASPYTGTTGQRDALLRHTIDQIMHTATQRGVTTIVIENLGFTDARDTGRETLPNGKNGKRFRKTVAGMPTAKFRDRLAAAAHRHSIRLIAVNPAYTSKWGKQHWLRPMKQTNKNVTGHHAAALVIGRRGQGHSARRKRTTRPGTTRGSRPGKLSTPLATSSQSSRDQHRTAGPGATPEPRAHRAKNLKPPRATVTPGTGTKHCRQNQ